MLRTILLVTTTVLCLSPCVTAEASTVVFFNSSQVATPVASGTTTDTVSSNGYLFTYTRDKLFTGGVGMTEPIGRAVRVAWPSGMEAQAVTTGPNLSGAKITIQRVDGEVFDLTALTLKLLANTAGAGGSLEIMPTLDGEDAFNDPLYFNASGYAGNTFSYDTSPNYLGSTALLKDFERYTMKLYVDYAITGLTLQSAAPGPSALCWSGSVNGMWDVDTTANFSGNLSGKFNDGDQVTFDDTGNHASITVAAGGVAPESLVFANTAAKDLFFSGGPIQGATSLTVSGGGRVVMSSPNTYTGGTIVSHGTLEIAHSNAQPAGTSLTVDAGGVVVLAGGGNAAGASHFSATAVPEPSSLSLLGAVAMGLLFGQSRRTRRK